jgi:multidrug resistance efflux pump
MSWLRKTRFVFVGIGIAACIGMLIGARTLTGGSAPDKSPRSDSTPRSAVGLVVLGTVDTQPPPIPYGLPPVLQSGTVKQVFVNAGDEITIEMIRENKHALYAFDDTIQQSDLTRAKAAVDTANAKVAQAKELVKQHNGNKIVAQEGVAAAKKKADFAAAAYNLTEQQLKDYYKNSMIPESAWPERLANDTTLFAKQGEYTLAKIEWDLAKSKLKQLDAVDPQVSVKEAEAAVKQAEAEVTKAQAAVDLCVVKAQMPGRIEQITIGPGATLGISTRTPALWLIPTGPGTRIVRAEVEADFAHRVGNTHIGREVTIYDHTDTRLTYKGTVDRISDAFLLKRANTENFLNGDTRVIEVIIKVPNPTPTGQPPLRVGQRVRVNLGQ